MGTENDDVKGLVKKIFPKTFTRSKAKVCPSEEEISSFIDGKLDEIKENNFISHLAECKDCLETVRFLRQKSSDEKVHVPAWLEQKAKEVFPARPKTWEIILERVSPAFKIAKHTAELCLTIPELKVVPAGKSFLSRVEKTSWGPKEKDEAPMTGRESPYVPGKFQKPSHTDFGESDRGKRAYDSSMEFLKRDEEDLYVRKEEARNVIKKLKGQIPEGFVFQEHMGDYSVYLLLTKKEDAETIEVQIEIRDSIGQPVEDMEILLVQGRKVLEKLLARDEIYAFQALKRQRLRIKFNHKGIQLGEAVLAIKK